MSVGIQGINCALAVVCLLWQLYITHQKLELKIKKPKPVFWFEVGEGMNALMSQVANAGE